MGAFISKVGFVLLFALFFSTIFIFMGFAFTPNDTNTGYYDADGNFIKIDTATQHYNSWSFSNIIRNINILPIWANTIIFGSIFTTIVFMIVFAFLPSGGD